MIHNAAYIRELVRKRLAGTITPMESALLRESHKLYSEAEWMRMTAEALEEMDAGMDGGLPEAPVMDLAAIRKRADRRELRARRNVTLGKLAIAALFLAVIGWATRHHWNEYHGPLERFGVCAEVADTLIPAWEFRGMVSVGTAPPVGIEPGVVGHIVGIGHVSVDRDPEGMLTISESTDSLAPAADGYRDIRIATAPGEQLGVRLPDGTEVRLNGASALYYAYPADTAAAIRVTGQAYVRVAHRVNGRPVVMETANSLLRGEAGGFVVHAGDRETVATLMDGQLVAVSRKDGRMERASARGDVISVTTHDVQAGSPGIVSMRKSQGEADGALQWAKITVDYRNVSLRQFLKQEGERFHIEFGDLQCLPKSKRINAAMCYRASVDDFLAAVKKEGLRVFYDKERGVYTFCDPATGKPWAKGVKADDRMAEAGSCEECRVGDRGFRPLAGFPWLFRDILF